MGRSRIALVLIAALTVVLTSSLSAQESKHPRIGLIFHGGPGRFFDPLQQGFAQLGYVEGRNIMVERRFAQGQIGRLPALAAELVGLDVDVIVAVGALGAQASQKATAKIPIVFSAVLDPVAVGLVTSLERPGGNITGVISFDPQQPRKQFELLKQVRPNLARVAILSDQEILPTQSDRGSNMLERVNDTAARAIGLQSQTLNIKGPNPDIEAAFAAMKKERAEALVVLEGPVTIAFRKKIAELAITHRVITMFVGGRTVADAGGLIAYGTSILDTLPRMPGLVDKILKGAKPGKLPIEVVTRPELVFNLKTAREIGVTIPQELVTRANQVIQ